MGSPVMCGSERMFKVMQCVISGEHRAGGRAADFSLILSIQIKTGCDGIELTGATENKDNVKS